MDDLALELIQSRPRGHLLAGMVTRAHEHSIKRLVLGVGRAWRAVGDAPFPRALELIGSVDRKDLKQHTTRRRPHYANCYVTKKCRPMKSRLTN